MTNFIGTVRIGFSDAGKYRVIVEYSDFNRHLTESAKKAYKLHKKIFKPSDSNTEKDIHAFDFESMDKANLFVGYCVYPFIDQDLGIFQNAAALSTSDMDSKEHIKEEKYFFDKDMNGNIEDGKNFFGYGHGFILRKQRKDMTKQLLKKFFSRSK